MKRFFTSLLILFSFSLFAQSYKPAEFHINDYSVLEKSKINITGPWDFFWGTFVSPYDSTTLPDCQVTIPQKWNSYNLPPEAAKIAATGKGAGTYRITITGLKKNTAYSFFAYDLASTAFTVLLDGKQIYSSGKPTVNYKKTKAEQNMSLVSFKSDDQGQAKLTFYVSNKDYRKGGLWKNVAIQEDRASKESFNKKIATSSLIAGILLAVVFYCFFISILNKDKGSMYLGLFSLVLLLRLCSADFSIIKYFLPLIPYSVMLRIEYTILFFGPAAYVLYLNALNPNIFKRLKAKFIAFPSIIFAILAYFTPLSFANKIIPVCEVYVAICIILSLFSLFIQAVRYDDFVSICTLSSLLIIAVGFANDLLLINFVKIKLFKGYKIIPWCFVLYTIFQAVILAYLENQKQTKLEQRNSHYRVTNAAYNRYIPTEALNLIGKKEIFEITSEEKYVRNMMILSASIENLNIEELSNNQIFKTLNMYIEEITPVIRNEGGVIIKNGGTNLLVVFPENPEKALLCAIKMQEKMKELRLKFREIQYPAIWIGIGIHYGTVALGTTGSESTITEFEMSRDIDITRTVEALTKTMKKQILVTKEGIAIAAKNYKAAGKKFEFHGNQVTTEANKELFALYSSTVPEGI